MARFQALDELALGLLDMLEGVLADRNERINGSRAPLHLLSGELDGTLAVVALDGLLDQLWPHIDPLRAAVAFDPADAEEVGVLTTVFAGALGVDQSLAALIAVDAATQVVGGGLGTLPGHPLFIEQRLHAVESVLVDQRLVTAVIDVLIRRATLVDDLARVVAVAEQALEHGGSELGCRPALARARADAQPLQLIGKLGNGVFAAAIELKGQGHVMPSLGVDHDDRHAATISQHVHAVEVAEGRLAVGAANAGLLFQPAFDVLAGLHRLELVMRGNHALVEKGGGAVLTGHRLGDRDKPCPGFADDLARLPVIDGIARPPRQAPDDHVVNAR